jgi:hypothetical protein
MSSFIELPQHAVVISCCKERKNSSNYGEPRKCSGQEIVRHMELLFENQTRLQQQYSPSQRRRNRRRRRIGEMAMAFCMKQQLVQVFEAQEAEEEGLTEARWPHGSWLSLKSKTLEWNKSRVAGGWTSRAARHWNGIKSGVAGGWTSRAARYWNGIKSGVASGWTSRAARYWNGIKSGVTGGWTSRAGR